ncbi:hypothetical protein WJX72_010846 [[Myrmecia] bisecta]|uniref:Uncharacterized protein n=1 Tax=[Myrmecia] bisecta TaxID=41462 RepID=A0AAW1P807_9CHLO
MDPIVKPGVFWHASILGATFGQTLSKVRKRRISYGTRACLRAALQQSADVEAPIPLVPMQSGILITQPDGHVDVAIKAVSGSPFEPPPGDSAAPGKDDGSATSSSGASDDPKALAEGLVRVWTFKGGQQPWSSPPSVRQTRNMVT